MIIAFWVFFVFVMAFREMYIKDQDEKKQEAENQKRLEYLEHQNSKSNDKD